MTVFTVAFFICPLTNRQQCINREKGIVAISLTLYDKKSIIRETFESSQVRNDYNGCNQHRRISLNREGVMRRKQKRESESLLTQLAILFCFILTLINGCLAYIYCTREETQRPMQTSIEKLEEKHDSTQEIVNKPLIVIDAGHGGNDPGTQSRHFFEKDLNLEIALKLKQSLIMKGYSVLMTREEDRFVNLESRADFANEKGADVFISIHQNSYIQDSTINGIETYYNDKKSSENQKLAQVIQEELIEKTGAYNRGSRVENQLIVTRETHMPAVLIETAFLSNPTELNLITSNDYQHKVIEGIISGIEKFFSRQ